MSHVRTHFDYLPYILVSLWIVYTETSPNGHPQITHTISVTSSAVPYSKVSQYNITRDDDILIYLPEASLLVFNIVYGFIGDQCTIYILCFISYNNNILTVFDGAICDVIRCVLNCAQFWGPLYSLWFPHTRKNQSSDIGFVHTIKTVEMDRRKLDWVFPAYSFRLISRYSLWQFPQFFFFKLPWTLSQSKWICF